MPSLQCSFTHFQGSLLATAQWVRFNSTGGSKTLWQLEVLQYHRGLRGWTRIRKCKSRTRIARATSAKIRVIRGNSASISPKSHLTTDLVLGFDVPRVGKMNHEKLFR